MARHDWSCLAMGAISGHAPPRPAVPSHGWAHTAGHALICLTSMTLRLFCERSFPKFSGFLRFPYMNFKLQIPSYHMYVFNDCGARLQRTN